MLSGRSLNVLESAWACSNWAWSVMGISSRVDGSGQSKVRARSVGDGADHGRTCLDGADNDSRSNTDRRTADTDAGADHAAGDADHGAAVEQQRGKQQWCSQAGNREGLRQAEIFHHAAIG